MVRNAFQSSPVPKDGCNLLHRLLHCLPFASFNPHPSRRTGATNYVHLSTSVWNVFQSSPVPKDGCNTDRALQNVDDPIVSILTRPEGRVQPGAAGAAAGTAGFQSSPVPKDGCNTSMRRLLSASPSFNPHPSRRTGATKHYEPAGSIASVSILTRPEGRVQRLPGGDSWLPSVRFNPHPSRRTGATRLHRFKSGPAWWVSILTRPEGRVQHCCDVGDGAWLGFQSSPVPKDGCNPEEVFSLKGVLMFQSSPVPKDGCN